MTARKRAPRNRTATLCDEERAGLRTQLASPKDAENRFLDSTFLGDSLAITPLLPRGFADLLFLDPPYNLAKEFGDLRFNRRSVEDYTAWLDSILDVVLPTLKPTGTVYICGEWRTSASILTSASRRLVVRNRITWEREKGRGAKANWKNASEDIWFCTKSEHYTFNVDAVKLRRRVVAPYKDEDGSPRDWEATDRGNFRDTFPSNLWTDISVPFWSMPENTDHPTQKSEKLAAKLMLASTNPGDTVFDPFLGSGTSSVVASKLGRRYVGIESCEEYALLAVKRLAAAACDMKIQGYAEEVFWERNTAYSAASSPQRRTRVAQSNGRQTRLL